MDLADPPQATPFLKDWRVVYALATLARRMLPETPSILVLLVATDGARWLPDVLRGLRAQKHRPISSLGVDNASSDGSNEILTKAFGVTRVVQLERRVGYGRALAAALKVAGDRGVEADAFLILHDDAVLEPGSITAMVEAMRATGAGIVGAKLVEWEDPRLLQDIGGATDRYGRVVRLVERGELDQGQHDGVREVQYASSAALLVAREVVETVGLFDLRFVALRDDLDLCWRARVAGWATVVTSDAKVRHAAAIARNLRASPVKGRTRYFADRNTLATLLKNYSLPRLLVALPVNIAIAFGVALLSLFTGRQKAALQTLEALRWNVTHLPSTLRLRVVAQRTRKRPDSEVTHLMRHGATRLRSQIEEVVERVVGTPADVSDADLDAPPPHVIKRLIARPGAVSIVIAAIVVSFGMRTLLSTGQVAGVDLASFPSAGGFLQEWASGWRGAGAGGAAPVTPGLLLLGTLTVLCFGSAWLAQRVLLVGLPLFGALSMWRFLRLLGVTPGARRLAVSAYAASPIVLSAFGAGRLPDLVVACAAPALLLPLMRAAWLIPEKGWRSTAFGIAGLAVTASLAPWAFVLVAFTGAALAVAVSIGQKLELLRPVLSRTVLMIVGALVLLFPWSIELFRSSTPLLAGGTDGAPTMLDLLGLSGGALEPIPRGLSYGLTIAALGGVIVAPSRRRRLVVILAALSVIGLVLAWASARGVTWIAPRPALPLSLVIVMFPVLAAIAFEAAGPMLRRRSFGIPHIGFAVLGLIVALQIGSGALWVARAEHPGLVASGTILPEHLLDESRRLGAFRVAWVGGSVDRPLAGLSGPEGMSMRSYLTRAAGPGAEAFERAVGAIVGGGSDAGGRMLGVLGVRYVVVRPDADAGIRDAIARQVDLEFFQRFRGAVVYSNEVNLPIAAGIASPTWLAASAGGLDAAAGVEPRPSRGAGFRARRGTSYVGRTPAAPVTVLLAEDHSDRWRARTSDGKIVTPKGSFGWAMRFDISQPNTGVVLEFRGQRFHRLMLTLEVILGLAFLAAWSRRAARERGER